MTFDDAHTYVVGVEGRLSMDPKDPGNWTGGKVNEGELRGTKYGISAKSYPKLDIVNLTLSDAKVIAKRDFWDKMKLDQVPYNIALALFDFGYNTGIARAARAAQSVLGITQDGVIGNKTIGLLNMIDAKSFARAYATERIFLYSQMFDWIYEGHGWTNRTIGTMLLCLG